MTKLKREEMRARIEQRLIGYVKIQRHVQFLVIYLFAYALICWLLTSSRIGDNPIFSHFASGPNYHEWWLLGFWSNLIVFFAVLFGICLFLVMVEAVRERYIQRAIHREMELEFVRLQIQLEQIRSNRSSTVNDKQKRGFYEQDAPSLMREDDTPATLDVQSIKRK